MNMWARLGSFTLILGAVGHFLTVDLLMWILESKYVSFPSSSFSLNQLKSIVVDWGVIGNTTIFYMLTGFSLWVVISLCVLGVYNLLIFNNLPQGHKLRLQSLILCEITSVIFLVIAAVCFIYPATLGGILAVIFFAAALQKEMQ